MRAISEKAAFVALQRAAVLEKVAWDAESYQRSTQLAAWSAEEAALAEAQAQVPHYLSAADKVNLYRRPPLSGSAPGATMTSFLPGRLVPRAALAQCGAAAVF